MSLPPSLRARARAGGARSYKLIQITAALSTCDLEAAHHRKTDDDSTLVLFPARRHGLKFYAFGARVTSDRRVLSALFFNNCSSTSPPSPPPSSSPCASIKARARARDNVNFGGRRRHAGLTAAFFSRSPVRQARQMARYGGA